MNTTELWVTLFDEYLFINVNNIMEILFIVQSITHIKYIGIQKRIGKNPVRFQQGDKH